ncbi:MAG: hypothetical protein P8Y65_05385 [Campylobacterales bacterium]
MKRILLSITAILVIVTALFAFLFTPPGNALLSALAEKKMQNALGLPAELTRFKLGIDHFEATVSLTENNTIDADGDYSLWTQTVSARYHARLQNLAALEPLTSSPLRGTFQTQGTLSGTFDDLHVAGTSDVAQSQTQYTADIVDYTPVSVTLSLNNADIARLLSMGGRPAFAEGRLAVEARFAPLAAGKTEGNLRINVAKGVFNTKVMKNEFNVTLPDTDFSFDADAQIHSAKADYVLSFVSNLARINSKGTLSPEPFAADLTYDVRFSELALLKPLTDAPLRGPFFTKGSVKGDKNTLTIEGRSDVAGSDTAYRSTLHDLEPASVTATIRRAQLDRLLYLFGEDALAYGSINADIDLQNLDPKTLQGSVNAVLIDGKLNRSLIQKRYELRLPDAALRSSLNATLDGNAVVYDAKIDSSVGQLASSGQLIPQHSGMDLKYALDLKELSLLKGLTRQPFRGPLALNGTLKGDKERLEAVAASNIAGSTTSLEAVLKAFTPVSATLDVKALKLKKLLYTLGRPQYADADVTLQARIPNLEPGKLDGTVALEMKNGKADKTVVANAFDWPRFKGATFSIKSATTLEGDRAESEIELRSDLATLHSAPVRYNFKSGILNADYTASLPHLSRLSFLTDRPLRGSAEVTGDLRHDGVLTLHANSTLAGGKVKATLRDKKLHADFNALGSLQALHMLTYPEIFDSKVDGSLDYDTGTKKGLLKTQLSQGYFTRNIAFDLLRQYSTLDLYNEQFKGHSEARINDNLIDADLLLHSNHSSLETQHARIDTKADSINARVHVEANDNPIDFRLKGSLNRPNVSVDAGKLIEREAGKQLEKLLDSFLK